MKQKTTLKVTHPDGQRRGLSRRRTGHGFRYFNVRGRPVDDPKTIERINALAIPPAWEDVWISPLSGAHLQAVGQDARQRKQYLYHPAWRAAKEREKYHRILEFAGALPRIRRRLRRDLLTQGLGFDKVLATIISLLDCSLIRIGNAEYARTNGSYGRKHKITSSDVNRYLQTIGKETFSAKDFRTWTATVLMIRSLLKSPPCSTGTAIKRNLKEGLLAVSSRLGNTPAICRKSYIHPLVLKRYAEKGNLPAAHSANGLPAGLFKDETQAYAILSRLLKMR